MKAVVFDKTGTLTIGRPAVVQTKIFSKISMQELSNLAAAAEVSTLILVKIKNILSNLDVYISLQRSVVCMRNELTLPCVTDSP